MTVPVICIDGPSGAGKGTLARNLAEQIGFAYMDSGALYRVLAVLAERAAVDQEQLDQLVNIASGIDVEFHNDQVLLNGDDLAPEVRLETTADKASKLAAIPEVRAALVQAQKGYAKSPGLVADGRDMGTAIFPHSPLKIFLTASADERAKRRLEQLKEMAIKEAEKEGQNIADALKNKGLNDGQADGSLRALVKEIESRDERDMNRAVNPLKAAADAVKIDCTSLSIDEVLQDVLSLWNDRKQR